MSNNVLVLGGEGYLGSYLCNYLADKGYSVIAYDLHIYTENTKSSPIKYVQGAIEDTEKVAKLVPQVDFVIDATGIMPGSKKQEKYDRNLLGLEQLLKSCFQSRIKRFVYISSPAVYGLHPQMPFLETYSLNAKNLHGLHKIKAEKYLCVP